MLESICDTRQLWGVKKRGQAKSWVPKWLMENIILLRRTSCRRKAGWLGVPPTLVTTELSILQPSSLVGVTVSDGAVDGLEVRERLPTEP